MAEIPYGEIVNMPQANVHFEKSYIGWSRGKGLVSKAIQKLDNSYFNHVYRRFITKCGLSLIYESHLSGGVQITPYEHLLSAKTKGIVEKTFEVEVPIDDADTQLLWNDCIPLHGKKYDSHQILLYFTWIRIFKRGSKYRKRLDKKNHPDKYTCNEFVLQSGKYGDPFVAGLDFSYTPEMLFKHINHCSSLDMFKI